VYMLCNISCDYFHMMALIYFLNDYLLDTVNGFTIP
jgi:hypothetical protein